MNVLISIGVCFILIIGFYVLLSHQNENINNLETAADTLASSTEALKESTETKSLLQSTSNHTEISDATIATPTVTQSATIDATTAPAMTPAPTQREFNVDDVIMQYTPESTCFSEIGYDSEWEILVVRFRDSGALYTYSDFSESAWNKFKAADSLGSWYNTHIKGQYEYEKIS